MLKSFFVALASFNDFLKTEKFLKNVFKLDISN